MHCMRRLSGTAFSDNAHEWRTIVRNNVFGQCTWEGIRLSGTSISNNAPERVRLSGTAFSDAHACMQTLHVFTHKYIELAISKCFGMCIRLSTLWTICWGCRSLGFCIAYKTLMRNRLWNATQSCAHRRLVEHLREQPKDECQRGATSQWFSN